MNNAPEILEEILNIEESISKIQELLKYDDGIPVDLQGKLRAHITHLVKQKNEIKQILNA